MKRSAVAVLIGTGLVTSFLVSAGCGSDHHDDETPAGPNSGAVCPSGSSLTYTTFAKTFFDTYCQSCHASALTGNARMGAPDDHPFDTLANIKAAKTHIDQVAASGAASTNTAMPPIGAQAPTLAERKQLGEWLACGAP